MRSRNKCSSDLLEDDHRDNCWHPPLGDRSTHPGLDISSPSNGRSHKEIPLLAASIHIRFQKHDKTILKSRTYKIQAWTLYSSSQNCPRLEFKLSWWPRCKLPKWNQKREYKFCDPILGKSGVLNVSYFLRWRPQCSRSSRRSSPCSSPFASPSMSSYPPPRYLYLYL